MVIITPLLLRITCILTLRLGFSSPAHLELLDLLLSLFRRRIDNLLFQAEDIGLERPS